MRKSLLLIFAVLFSLSTVFAAGDRAIVEQIDAPQPNGLEMEISTADSKGGIYKEGDSLKIKVVFRNISSSDYYIHSRQTRRLQLSLKAR